MTTTRNPGNPEAGFTLIEALTAIVILSFGLIAVANLIVVAGNSNLTANQSTSAADLASQRMETLKATPFDTLVSGCGSGCGGLTTDTTTGGRNYFETITVKGSGTFKTRWVVTPISGQAQLYFVGVRTESVSPLMAARTRADFTTFRACTLGTTSLCPAAP